MKNEKKTKKKLGTFGLTPNLSHRFKKSKKIKK